MADFHELGKEGEMHAIDFLQKKGYKLLEKNWRKNHLEVDLIFLDKDTLVIVEVKTRSTNIFGEPEEFVTKNKQKNLIKAANAYINIGGLDYEVRFDIISVLKKGQKVKIHHIEDAFYPTL